MPKIPPLFKLFVSISLLTLFCNAVNGQSISYKVSPAYLRYDSSVDITFTLQDHDCPGKMMFYSHNEADDTVAWSESNNYYSHPDSTTIELVNANYSNTAKYYAQCLATIVNYQPYPLNVVIPVVPKILGVNIVDADQKSVLKSTEVINAYRTNYEFTTYFGDITGVSTLFVDVGDGDKGDGTTVGFYTISGDHNELIYEYRPNRVLGIEPEYPNGTIHEYWISCNKWAYAKLNCSATLTARTEIPSTTDMYHEAHISMDLNFKPQGLRTSATSTREMCEVSCQYTASCPLTDDVTLKLDLYDDNGIHIAGNTVITNRDNKVTVTITNKFICRDLVILAKSNVGSARCLAKNKAGTVEASWYLGEVDKLATLYFPDETFVWEWWMILLIIISGLFFIVIVGGIAAIVVKSKKSKGKDNKEDGTNSTVYISSPQPVNQGNNNNNNSNNNNNAGPQSSSYPVEERAYRSQTQYVRQTPPAENNYQMQQYSGQQARPHSLAGSSFYDGNNRYHEYDMPYTPQPIAADPSRTVAFSNTPRSRQPLVGGAYDNGAYAPVSYQPTVRAEAIV